MWDVFLSYAGAECARAISVAEALEAAGLTVWFDRNDLRDHETISDVLAQGLAQSRALLALYSPTYHRRRACQWELASAWLAGGAEAQRGLATRFGHRVMVAQCGSDMPRGVEGHKRFTNADDLPALVAGVRDYLATLPEGPMGTPGKTGRTQGRPLPPTRFVGRTEEMWQVHVGLQGETTVLAGSTNSPKGGHGLAQLNGCGGMGKTLLATEYVARFGAAWPGGVFWLRAGGPDGKDNHQGQLIDQLYKVMLSLMTPQDVGAIRESLKTFAPEEMIISLKAALSGVLPQDTPWLWVVDDLPLGLTQDEARLWEAPSVAGTWGRTLFTTRNQSLGGVGRQIMVQELDPDAAYALLTARIPPQDGDEGEEAAARTLCETLGHYALALDIAGALRALVYPSYQALAEAIAQAPEVAYNNDISADLPGDYSDNILKALGLSLNVCPPEALDLLKMAACLAPGVPIPCGLLKAAGANKPEYNADLLRQASLVTLKEGAFTLHAAVTHAVRLSYEECKEVLPQLADALSEIFEQAKPLGTVESQVGLSPFLPHVDAVTADPKTEEEIYLLLFRGQALSRGGLLSLAQAMEEKALHAARAYLEKEHPNTLICMNNLASTLRARGDLAEARSLQDEALSVGRNVLGAEHPYTLASMNNLAGTLLAQGDYAGARRLHEEVISVSRRVLGAEHPDVLTMMNNLAATLKAQGDYAGARRLLEEVLLSRFRILGPEHPATLTIMNNLAETLKAQGDHVAARSLQEKELSICSRVLGSEHPDTLTSMSNLAATLRAQGDHVGAHHLHEEALSGRRRVLGPEHSDTLTSMNNLAETLRAQGDHVGARRLHEEALSGRRRVLGAEHPDTLTSEHGLACTLWEMGLPEQAFVHWETAVKGLDRALGPDHPTTQQIRRNYLHAKQA